jgi:hypothetical protein
MNEDFGKCISWIIVIFLVGLFIYNWDSDSKDYKATRYIEVKYRDKGPVNVMDYRFDDHFFNDGDVRKAYYDSIYEYMIINLNGTYYHYCGMDEPIWEQFVSSKSGYWYYKNLIKGNYDCREGHVPNYPSKDYDEYIEDARSDGVDWGYY